MNSDFWNQRYSADEFVYGTTPNDFFRETIDTIVSGKILLPAEGEGRNAVYAAQKGWLVDAFDTSSKAMEKAMKLASDKKVKINYQIDDVIFFQPKLDFYNVAAITFLHLPRQQRRILSVKLWEALRPGGKFIMEAFSKQQLNYQSGGPKEKEILYSEAEIHTDFPCFKVELLQTVERDLKEGTHHFGKASVIRFIGVK